jgi:hypothetical protein
VIDLAAEVAEALARAGLTVETIRTVVRDEVRRALAEREQDRLVDVKGLAQLIGAPTSAAAKQRVHRDGELAALALRVGRVRRWRTSDVLALLEARRPRR